VVGSEYGLDTHLPFGLRFDRLVSLMSRDKKALSGMTFVLDGASGVEVVAGVASADVLHALEDMAAHHAG
jgi:5-deoxy-5-amino-3-dehydroquinate synthase